MDIETIKVKYAIHEACREGQSLSTRVQQNLTKLTYPPSPDSRIPSRYQP